MDILIANESRLVGEGVRMILKSSFSEAKVEVTDCASDLLKQLDIETRDHWHIILIDDKLSEFLPPNRLHKLSPKAKICLFQPKGSQQNSGDYYREGYNALLLASSTLKQAEHVINTLLSGQNCFPEEVDIHTKKASSYVLKHSPNPCITFRQQEILSLMALGLSNKEVASHFGLTESTVKRHLSNIFKKLGAQNRVEAARIGSERQLLFNS